MLCNLTFSRLLSARDHGTPQLNNYAQLIVDVTDVNDNIPNILITEINGTHHQNQPIALPECTTTGNEFNLDDPLRSDRFFFLQEPRCIMSISLMQIQVKMVV